MHLSGDDLTRLGLLKCGRDVRIHPTVQFFNPRKISIGDNVRIDCFSLLSAGEEGIAIGNHIHIGAGTYLFGSGGAIVVEDFSGISPRASLFTASDDFTKGFLRGPMVPLVYRKLTCGAIRLQRNAVIGAGAVVLPGVVLGKNSSIGALAVVADSVPDNCVYVANGERQG